MSEIEKIAQGADFIVNGYSFFCQDSMVRVLNQNNLACAAVLSRNGDTVLQNAGILNDRELRKIQKFIKLNYQEMYLKWSAYSQNGFYGEDK